MQTEVVPTVDERTELESLPEIEEEPTRHVGLMILGIALAIVAIGFVTRRLFGGERTF
jgi:hypothetical protein